MPIGIQICSGSEWRAIKPMLGIDDAAIRAYPYGEMFELSVAGRPCVFFWCRRTKTRAAGACQYAIDHWHVDPLVVLGTCAGVGEGLRVFDVIYASQTVQYDCEDARPDMGRVVVADRSWLSLDELRDVVHVGPIANADHDLTYDHLEILRKEHVLGGDWESGAIAHVCALNRVRWAIFRGISDVPRAPDADDLRRQLLDFQTNTPAVMAKLLELLPAILRGIL
jgi:adenosylhomocysteine nucleosidase